MRAEMSEPRNAKLAKVGCVCLGDRWREAQREQESRTEHSGSEQEKKEEDMQGRAQEHTKLCGQSS